MENPLSDIASSLAMMLPCNGETEDFYGSYTFSYLVNVMLF